MNPNQGNAPLTPNTQQTYDPATPSYGQPPSQPDIPPQQPKQRRKLLIILSVFIIVLCVGLGIFFILGNKDKTQTNNQPESKTPTATPSQEAPKTTTPDPTPTQSNAPLNNKAEQLATAVNEFTLNNNGRLPSLEDIDSAFVGEYLDGSFNDPTTNNPYTFVESTPLPGEIQYKTSAVCGTNNDITPGTSRQAAIRILQASGTYYCANN